MDSSHSEKGSGNKRVFEDNDGGSSPNLKKPKIGCFPAALEGLGEGESSSVYNKTNENSKKSEDEYKKIKIEVDDDIDIDNLERYMGNISLRNRNANRSGFINRKPVMPRPRDQINPSE